MGPYRALRGPEVSVEQTLIADSPRPTFMRKTNQKMPYAAGLFGSYYLIGERALTSKAGTMENGMFLSCQARELWKTYCF
jgi:hypothetical protein